MTPLARATCALSGLGDLATGLLLVAAPALALRLMRVAEAPDETIWLRFIGAFVGGVGLVHAWGLLREPRGGARLSHLMEATALLRAVIATFTGAAVAAGALSWPWLSVTATDVIFSLAQFWLLRRGEFGHAG